MGCAKCAELNSKLSGEMRTYVMCEECDRKFLIDALHEQRGPFDQILDVVGVREAFLDCFTHGTDKDGFLRISILCKTSLDSRICCHIQFSTIALGQAVSLKALADVAADSILEEVHVFAKANAETFTQKWTVSYSIEEG